MTPSKSCQPISACRPQYIALTGPEVYTFLRLISKAEVTIKLALKGPGTAMFRRSTEEAYFLLHFPLFAVILFSCSLEEACSRQLKPGVCALPQSALQSPAILSVRSNIPLDHLKAMRAHVSKSISNNAEMAYTETLHTNHPRL